MSWWRSHSLRISLTLWNVTAMILVLAVYAGGVFVFVSRNASASLDDEIRHDYQWAAAMADQLPDGSLKWFEEESSFGENSPWLQVWCGDVKGCGRGSTEGQPCPLPRPTHHPSSDGTGTPSCSARGAWARFIAAPIRRWTATSPSRC